MSDQLPQERNSQNTSSLTALQELDTRIARATSLDEVILLTQVRGELIRQNNQAADLKNARFLKKWDVVSKTLLSFAGLTAGSLLLLSDYKLAGLFVLGASLYPLAPRFTMGFFKRGHTGEDKNED